MGSLDDVEELGRVPRDAIAPFWKHEDEERAFGMGTKSKLFKLEST